MKYSIKFKLPEFDSSTTKVFGSANTEVKLTSMINRNVYGTNGTISFKIKCKVLYYVNIYLVLDG